MSDSNKGGKNKKYGRNRAGCLSYRNAHKWEKNKARRMIRTFKANPTNRTLAERILHHDRHTMHFSIGADVRAMCTRATAS